MSNASVFRQLLDQLAATKGHTPHWPIVLRHLLAADFQEEQSRLAPYKGTVPIRREDRPCNKPEEKDVRRLYKLCEDHTGSIFTIGDEKFLLLGWQWPNQGSEKGRRADLVGMTRAGGLVVFEAKRASNPYSPMMAMLEGLDYLAHLTLKKNFAQITEAFEKRVVSEESFPVAPFGEVRPDVSACHEVIVLAPEGYLAKHSRSGKRGGRGHGWRELAGTVSHESLTLQLRFATTDFKDTSAIWA